jgi:hypothetical protein
MKKTNWFGKKEITKLVLAVIVTVIGIVGLIKAPAKSGDNLKKELQQNKEMLEADAATETFSAVVATESEGETAAAAETETETETGLEGLTFVGDSVMLGAAAEMKEQMPDAVIDAEEGRQARDGLSVVEQLDSEKRLGNVVVIALGINCYFNPSTGQEIIDYLGKDRTVYWVKVYGKYLQDQKRINGVIDQLAADNDNVTAIEWDTLAAEHPDWFYDDGIHVNGEGRKGFAAMLKAVLYPDEQ